MAKGRIEKGDIVADGVLKSFNAELELTSKNVDILKLSLKAVEETAKKLKKGVSTVKPKDVKSIQEFNDLTIKSNANLENRLQIDKKLLTEEAKLKKLRSDQTKAIKTEIALGDKQINTLEKLRARNAAIKIAKDKVNFSTKKGQDAIRKLNAELNRNNKILEKNASALGKQKIGIGKYSKAISGLRSGLVQLGLGMGVFQILKNSFNIVKDFEQSQADLASVLGINVDAMSALTEQAKELGKTTTFTASQVSLLQKEFAKLGFSMSEIENVTEATLLLAEATGTDLGRAAEVTGATIRGFGLTAKDTQRVVDVMAKSFSSSSLDMEKFATAMASVAPIAKVMGFSIEQTTSMLGALTDSGLDASTAGTSLRNMMLEARKQGLSWNEALEKVNNAQDKASVSLELFGKRGVAAGIILAENQDKVEGLTDKLLDADGAAKKMAETQRNTLGGAIKLLTSVWEGFILKMNEAGGAGDKLRRGIVFLADNFDKIINVLKTVIKLVIGFKLAMKAIKFSESIGGLKGIGKALKGIGQGAKGATKGVKGLGKALKGIGLGLAISALLELAVAFYDIASGAAEARRQQDLFNAAQKKGSEVVEEFLKKEDRKNKREKERLELLRANKDITGIEFEKQMKALEEGKLNRLERERSLRAEEILVLTTKQHLLRKQNKLDIEAIKNDPNIRASDRSIQLTALQNKFNAELKKNNNLLVFKSRAERAFATAVIDSTDSVHDYTVNIASNTLATRKSTTATKESTDSLEKQALALKALENISPEREDIDIADTNREKLERNVLEAEYNILIADVNITEEERNNLLIRQILHRAELEKLGKTEAEKQVIDARALRDANDVHLKEVETVVKKEFDLKKESIDLLTEFFIANADKRIAKINEEIDAATKQADHFRTLAENGNITAKESLAEQNRLIAEANIQKEQEEKRKQRIQMVSAVLSAFNANLQVEGTTSAEAFTKAITSTTLLTQFIGALPTFLEGTEDTGSNGRGVDGKGGFNAILHPNEGVLKKEHNQKKLKAGLTNESMVDKAINFDMIMEQHRVGNYMDGSVLIAQLDNAELINGLSSLQSEMSEVKQAILNQPKESNNTAEMLSNYVMFNNVKTQGGKTTTSRFKVQR